MKLAIKFAKVNSSVVGDHGLSHNLRIGDAWLASDPLVKKWPQCFTDSPIVVVNTSGGPKHIDEL